MGEGRPDTGLREELVDRQRRGGGEERGKTLKTGDASHEMASRVWSIACACLGVTYYTCTWQNAYGSEGGSADNALGELKEKQKGAGRGEEQTATHVPHRRRCVLEKPSHTCLSRRAASVGGRSGTSGHAPRSASTSPPCFPSSHSAPLKGRVRTHARFLQDEEREGRDKTATTTEQKMRQKPFTEREDWGSTKQEGCVTKKPKKKGRKWRRRRVSRCGSATTHTRAFTWHDVHTHTYTYTHRQAHTDTRATRF